MAHFPKPFFKKGRGLWYVQIDGRQVNLGPDKEAAFKQYHALMQSPTPVVAPQVSSSPLVVVLADAYLDWVKRERSADTFEWYRYRLERFAKKFPDLKTGDLKPHHVQEWLNEYPDLSRTSRRNYVRSVKTCLTWAVQQGYIEKNPIAHMPVPSAEHREITVSVEEYQTLLEAIPDPAFRDLVIVTWETGCRPQESLRVEARHVDLKRKRWVFPKSEAKGKRQPRVVYLTEPAFEITARLVKENPTGLLFRNGKGDPWTTEAVNCAFDRVQTRMGKAEFRQKGNQVPEDLIQAAMKKLSKTRTSQGVVIAKSDADLRCEAKAKASKKFAAQFVPRYSLYALRHAWATRALESGLDGLTVAILMGHSDPSTLARVYQHLSHNPEHLLAQARKATPPASA